MKKIFKKRKKEKNIIENFQEGIYEDKDKISPSCIDTTNPKYLKIDDIYYFSFIVTNYYHEYDNLILEEIIEINSNIIFSMYYEKQDKYKSIRDLTYYIGNNSVDLKDKSNNVQDKEIVALTYNDAQYIRKELQLNNEELYFLSFYITIYTDNKKELEYQINKIEGILQAKGIQVKRAYFRQESVFLATLPLFQNKMEIKNVSKRNILTSGLTATYPFISSSVLDKNGIFIGTNLYNNSLIFIDKYDVNKYKNANMCIFGTSGAGKSFYIKLCILRYRLMGIEQYVIDPENEYSTLCNNLNGVVIKIRSRF